MVKSVDALDSKSSGGKPHDGSSPSSGTIYLNPTFLELNCTLCQGHLKKILMSHPIRMAYFILNNACW